MVEQWDTEELPAIAGGLDSTNSASAHALPPTHTKSWFHPGISIGGDKISQLYEKEYFQVPRTWLVPDTVLPAEIAVSEEHDAYRALKGCLLRQEIFIDDAPPNADADAIAKALLPLSVVETNFTLTRAQPKDTNGSAVFFVTPRETISHHFERNLDDPRISHQIVLESNEFGQTLREVAIGYGRRIQNQALPTQWDRDTQTKTYLTYSQNTVTNGIDDAVRYPHSFRLPINCERRQYELTGLEQPDLQKPFTFNHFNNEFELLENATEIGYEISPDLSIHQKRLLKISRTVLRNDDLTGLLPLGQMGRSCLPGQSYGLVFTSEMFDKAYKKNNTSLFPSPATMLTSRAGDGGGFLSSSELKSLRLFPEDDPYDGYWISGALTVYSSSDDAATELVDARNHFFRARRSRDPFGAENSVIYDKYDLLIVETLNAMGNLATIGERDSSRQRASNGNDYRTLQPRLITDANGNRAAVSFDALGSVAGSAVMGKREERVGDTLIGFEPDLPESVVLAHLTNPTLNAKDILHGATSRTINDLFAYTRTKETDNPQPSVAYSISRTIHEAALGPNQTSEMRHGFSYSDGFGRVIQGKTQVKPGPVARRGPDGRILLDEDGQPILTDGSTDPRWASTGWVVYNNKGLAVARFEPIFTHIHAFEFDIRAGIAPILFYDPIGRVIAALHPNNSYVKQIFTPWGSEEWDQNDTVELDPRTDPDIKQYSAAYFAGNPEFQSWLQERLGKPPTDLDRQAAEKTNAHARTPTVSHFDSLGRPFLAVGWNKVVCQDHELNGTDWRQYTRIELDIEGHGLIVRDANSDEGNDPRGRVVESYEYDMLGRAMIRRTMDSGTRIWLMNALGQPLYQWDDRGHRIKTTYDKAGRHLFSSVLGDNNAPGGSTSEVIFNFNVYGEHHPRAAELNLRGGMYLSVDQAGLTANERKDFKGNLLESSRRFNIEYKSTVDWSSLLAVIPKDMDPGEPCDEALLKTALDSELQQEVFRDSAVLDAQNRLLQLTSPNSSGKQSTSRFTYSVGSLVKIDALIHGASSWTPFINDLDYDARGLRTHVDYANGVTTTYKYSNTGELKRLLSTRFTSTGDVKKLQDLNYTYDPSQYHTHISDASQQTVYFRNQVVEPTNDYIYDALYQLIRASGREHLGQPGGSPIPYASNDDARSGPQPGDEKAMARYTEDYVYDHTGNMKKMRHGSNDPNAPGHSWTRFFTHDTFSQLEPAKHGNRLSHTTVGASTENFSYDSHGNMVRMPHLGGPPGTPNVTWDFLDNTKKLDLGGGGTAYYVYDRTGERVRKVIEKAPNLSEERLYVGGTLEIFRRHQSGRIKLERESLHIIDDKNRVALVETRTIDVDAIDRAPEQVQRYQLSSHLKSATIELDHEAKVLTYEEYSPYGSTTYSARLSSLELPKCYRFTGKERDEESGLFYHGARYYAPWIARWTSCDPNGAVDGLNLYQYCSSNPIRWSDPTGTSGEAREWSKYITKGRDAEKHAYEMVKNTGEAVEKEVFIGKWTEYTEKGVTKRVWSGFKRLDLVTKEAAIQVKWVGIQVDKAGNLIESEALRNRVINGLNDARKEVKAIADHAEGLSNPRSWRNNRLLEIWKDIPDKKGKHILRFVVDGEPKVVDQFRKFAQNVAENVTKVSGKAPYAVEAIAGTGRSVGQILKPIAGAALGGLMIAGSAYSLAAADNWTDRGFAAAELATGVVALVPGLQGVALGLGLAIGAAKLGVWAWGKWGPGAQSPPPEAAPPVEKPPEPALAPEPEPAPSQGPDIVDVMPEPQSDPAPTPAPAPTPQKKSGGGSAKPPAKDPPAPAPVPGTDGGGWNPSLPVC